MSSFEVCWFYPLYQVRNTQRDLDYGETGTYRILGVDDGGDVFFVSPKRVQYRNLPISYYKWETFEKSGLLYFYNKATKTWLSAFCDDFKGDLLFGDFINDDDNLFAMQRNSTRIMHMRFRFCVMVAYNQLILCGLRNSRTATLPTWKRSYALTKTVTYQWGVLRGRSKNFNYRMRRNRSN